MSTEFFQKTAGRIELLFSTASFFDLSY